MDGAANSPRRGQPVIRTIAMPADTNPAGDIFGGWLMSQMDLAAGNLAARTARGRAATVAVDGMRFHLPVKVGDEVSLFASLTRRGRTSMHIHVTAWRRSRQRGGEPEGHLRHLRLRRPRRRGAPAGNPRLTPFRRERTSRPTREAVSERSDEHASLASQEPVILPVAPPA